jgi:hypothetical protein
MFDYSPADDNGRSFDALDANDADPDEETFAVPLGYRWTDVHGVQHGGNEGWTK